MSAEHDSSRTQRIPHAGHSAAASGGAVSSGKAGSFAAFLVVCWSVILVIMVFSSAGSVIVGPGQIQKSDVVVSARLVPQGRDRVEVERVFKGDEIERGAVLRVLNLPDVGAIDSQMTLIFPLTRFHGDFTVTKLDGQRSDTKPMVYPATTATIEQTKSALRQ